MEAEELATVAGKLNTDEIADLAADLPKRTMLKILRSLNSKERKHLNAILSYQDNQVGALMDFGMITIRDDLSLKAIIAYIRNWANYPVIPINCLWSISTIKFRVYCHCSDY